MAPLSDRPEPQPDEGTSTEAIEDARGLLCPIPVIRLAQRIAASPIRGTVLLLADDPAAPEDVRLWCLGHRHELVSSATEGRHFRIRVRRSR